MSQKVLPDREEALWQRARAAGMTRRQFLLVLSAGGAAAVLAACGVTTPSPTPVPTPVPTPLPLVKPTPSDLFISLGLNQETRLERLLGYITPAEQFFVRNHFATPRIDVQTWRLKVEGNAVERPLELTYDDLLNLPSRSVIRYVECAGNGRSFYRDFLGQAAEGGQWRLGAIGVAEWTGVPLGEVLDRAGLKPTPKDILNVLIEGGDEGKVRRPITVEKALDPDTLLAYAMNGEALPPDHGFPVRAITPGWGGINNIKWASRIEVRDSKIDVPTTTATYILDGPDYPDKPPIRMQTLKSAVKLPWPATMAPGRHLVQGYAWSPNGRIIKVEISLDGGPWQDASLQEPNIPRAWVRWSFWWDATLGDHTITARATDEKGDTQPNKVPWNRLGYLYNAVVPHPVKVA